MAQHRKEDQGRQPAPAEEPLEEPAAGPTKYQFYDDVVKLVLEVLKIINRLVLWLTLLR